jgi:cyanamide hydratase
LQAYGAPKEQAESVTEAIIRHQDLGDIGTISTVGQLIQLSTLYGTATMRPPFHPKSKSII